MSEKVTRTLPVELTEYDKQELSQEITNLNIKIYALEAEKKKTVAVFSGQIKALQGELSESCDVFQKGFRDEQVECYWLKDCPTVGKKTLIRYDTSEEVETRDMDMADMQHDFSEVSGSFAIPDNVDPPPEYENVEAPEGEETTFANEDLPPAELPEELPDHPLSEGAGQNMEEELPI